MARVRAVGCFARHPRYNTTTKQSVWEKPAALKSKGAVWSKCQVLALSLRYRLYSRRSGCGVGWDRLAGPRVLEPRVAL